jgi:hypothetical protein
MYSIYAFYLVSFALTNVDKIPNVAVSKYQKTEAGVRERYRINEKLKKNIIL